MESCFPPLAALSLRGSLGGKKQKNRHSLGSHFIADTDSDHYQLAKPPAMPHSQSAYGHQQLAGGQPQPQRDYLTKLEVLQDLDLYYIRQMASSLKVRRFGWEKRPSASE